MENFAFNPQSPILENNIAKQEVVENLSLVLEACSKNNEEIHIVENAVTASPTKLSELYDKVEKKYKATLGVFLFVASSYIGFDSIQTEKEAPIQEDSFEQAAGKKEAMKKAAGFDVAQEAEKVGRHAKFYSPEKPTKFTIIHIGQTHDTTPTANYQSSDEIAESQTEIGSFLAETTTAKSDVFIEGYTVEGEEEYHSSDMKELASRINNSQKFNDIEKAYHDGLASRNDKRSIAILNNITGSKLATLGFTEVKPLIYSDGTRNLYLIEPGYFPRDKDYTFSNETYSVIAGAAQILSARGQINIKPAETREEKSKVFQLQDKLSEKGKTLIKFFVSSNPMDRQYNSLMKGNLANISEFSGEYVSSMAQSNLCKKNIECQEITKEVMEIYIPAIKKAVMDDREDIAVELIAKQAKTSTQNVFPLVYGKGHDFTRAVEKWNKAHPEEQFNLVTVK